MWSGKMVRLTKKNKHKFTSFMKDEFGIHLNITVSLYKYLEFLVYSERKFINSIGRKEKSADKVMAKREKVRTKR